jgi:predicted dehydrogenase
VKAALIGAGQIARQHLGCLQTLPGVELAGICDLSPATAECFAERYGVGAWFTDHREMLAKVRPDVVHVTTPPTSHFRLASDALDAGAHVIVEKPATSTLAELEALVRQARARGRALVEDHNYVFNAAPQEILRRVATGEFGAVTHVEIAICLDILGPGGFADPNVTHSVLSLAGGAIADFLPHLASLAHAFVGPHRRAHSVWSKRRTSVLPHDEFRAVVEAERGTAALAFSASTQPDGFWLRVYGERMHACANLFETRLTFTKVRPGPKPLMPLMNGLEEARDVRRAAIGTLLRKFKKGPGAYEGLWELVGRAYRAFDDGSPGPVPPEDVLAVNRLVDALKPGAGAPAPRREGEPAPVRVEEVRS